jgi:hypothetical protein
MKTIYSSSDLYSLETEERLETVNLPLSEIIENCCTDFMSDPEPEDPKIIIATY